MTNTDGLIYRKIKDMINKCEDIDAQNEIKRIKLQQYLASRLRFSNSEIGEILAKMQEEDIRRKRNRLGIRIR